MGYLAFSPRGASKIHVPPNFSLVIFSFFIGLVSRLRWDERWNFGRKIGRKSLIIQRGGGASLRFDADGVVVVVVMACRRPAADDVNT